MELSYVILIGVIAAFSVLLLIISLKFLPSIGISPIAIISVFFTLILFTGIIACLYLLSKLVTKLDSSVEESLRTINVISETASSALNTASIADANATTALQTANGISGVANQALTNATTSLQNANTALQTANAISGVAFSAFNTANTAINVANNASDKVDTMKDDVDKLKDDVLVISTEMNAANVKLDATKQAFDVIFDAINIEKYQGSAPDFFRYDETIQVLTPPEENPV